MPVVPFFDPDTGASGGPTGGGPTPPAGKVWLNVPTQIVGIPNTVVTEPDVAITLNTPTNGVAPYTWKVIPTFPNPSYNMMRQYGTGGQNFELAGVRNLGSLSDRYNVGVTWKVIVEDSEGNWGIGMLIIYEQIPDEVYPATRVFEQVLSPTQTEYQFPARSTPPFATTYNNTPLSGTGFCYPSNVEPSMSTNHEATQFIVTVPPGGFCAFGYTYFLATPNRYERVWLIVRRELASADMDYGWAGWEESQDFLDFSAMPTFTPTTPLGTGTSQNNIIANNAVTGRDYPAANLAYAQTAGTTPALEQVSYSGGLATCRTESNSGVASNRQIWLSFFPRTYQNIQDTATRNCSLGTDSGLMVRIKYNLTLRGIWSFADLRVGPSSTTGKYVGVRFQGRGNNFLIGTDEPIIIQSVRGGSTIMSASIRRPLMEGLDWGLDFLSVGGQTYWVAYPWDPAWTDFPEYRADRFGLLEPPANTIGPTSTLQDAVTFAPYTPYGMGPYPLAQSDASLAVTNGNSILGVHLGMNCGNNSSTDGGGTLLVKEVKYEWKNLFLR